jgi:hypothetical protein
MPKLIALCITIIVLPFLFGQAALAQEMATVPDIKGLSVPQAAALLNQNGLNLGAQTNALWTESAGVPQNSIGGQSVAAGQSIQQGSAVDVTVLRSPNVTLLFDDNDLTLINRTGGSLDLNGIIFQALDGSAPAGFEARRWRADALPAGECAQIWSVGRGTWMTTNRTEEHFWTGGGGTTRFSVQQNGVERAACAIADLRCDFYMSAIGISDDITQYVYFAYTQDQLVVINKSENSWMALDGVEIINNAPAVAGSPFAFGNPGVFNTVPSVGKINLLAPGQCLLYTNSAPQSDALPEACSQIARLDLDPNVVFWSGAFGVNSVTDDKEHICPGATEGKLTICIMPR